MRKADFIKAVAEKLDTTQKEARHISEKVFEVVEDGLVLNKSVPLGNIGKVETVERAARKGRNPQTGEEIQIPSRNAIRYRASEYGKRLVQ